MRSVFVLATFALTTSGIAESPEREPAFSFGGTITINGSAPHSYETTVPVGYVRYIDFSDIRLELTTPDVDGAEAITYIKVLRRDGEDFRILKRVLTKASSTRIRSYSFAVCGDRVASRKPANELTCAT